MAIKIVEYKHICGKNFLHIPYVPERSGGKHIPFDQIGHQIEYEKFKMLHEVIEEADLEDEYQEWRRAYGYV